jgi:LysM repeat protein
MARKIFIFLLLIAGWAIIFTPLVAKPAALSWSFGARPAGNLPQPWKSGAAVLVAPREKVIAAEETGVIESTCPAQYTIRSGDSLGAIARRCGVNLSSLLAANPQISNPNRVNTGQVVAIPAGAGRGGGDDLAQTVVLDGGYAPGSVIDIQASGLPAGTPLRVGIGLSSSGYRVIEQSVSGLDGSLALSITIPGTAQPGEQGFILITTAGVPSVQVISPVFTIQ